MWIVIDCNVLVDGSGQGVPEHRASSYELLESLINRNEFVLAVDPKGKIRQQYDNRIAFPMHAHNWLLRLLPHRIRVVPQTRIPKAVLVQLREVHFDQKDIPLVEAACGSERTIVTRDFNSFTKRVQTILRQELGVRVLSSKQMLDDLAVLDARNQESQEG